MAMLYNRLTAKKEADIVKLADMIGLFCQNKHQEQPRAPFQIDDDRLRKIAHDLEMDLCPECSRLLRHGMIKLMLCAQDPKPMCKHCPIQCYAPAYKQQILAVMKYVSQGLSQMGSGSPPMNR
jgi:hypothetical protein